MAAPLVSVLMPVYNAEATLAEALDSLQAQTLGDLEIVAVDDGSTDGTAELLRQRQADDPRVRPILAPHEGLIAALNRGLATCRGSLVARMDGDDRCHPDRLRRQIELLTAQPEVSVAGCLVELFPADASAEGFRIYLDWLNGLVDHESICREIYIESPIVHPSAVVRREELIALGGYQDRGWAEDYDLWLRYCAAGRRFAKVPEVLLWWREHPGRLTRIDGRYSVENFLRAKAHYLAAGPLRERESVVLWGAGKTGRRLSKHLIRAGHRPVAFIDIDPAKIGGRLRGVPILAPESLAGIWQGSPRPMVLAAVASRGARELVRVALNRLRLREGADYLCVA